MDLTTPPGLIGDLGHPDLGVTAPHDAAFGGVEEATAGILVIMDGAVVSPPTTIALLCHDCRCCHGRRNL